MNNSFQNKKILITAGPTREYLDPVRFITNESSGRMGYAIAETFYDLGADVYLISGPVDIETRLPSEKITFIKTAKEMYEECQKHFYSLDIAVFCAAVSDYAPKNISDKKIKKSEDEYSLELKKNVDIAYEFGKIKTRFQKSIGFALETNDVLENSKVKLEKKNFDLIVINSPGKNQGFGHLTNKISILRKDLHLQDYVLKSKKAIAGNIADAIIDYCNALSSKVELS